VREGLSATSRIFFGTAAQDANRRVLSGGSKKGCSSCAAHEAIAPQRFRQCNSVLCPVLSVPTLFKPGETLIEPRSTIREQFPHGHRLQEYVNASRRDALGAYTRIVMPGERDDRATSTREQRLDKRQPISIRKREVE
jgi:hypothetical protein